MTVRKTLRFVPYRIAPDPLSEPEYEAVCVSGDDADCGAASGTGETPMGVAAWQFTHSAETGHTRFRRTFHEYTVTEPADGSECAIAPRARAAATAPRTPAAAAPPAPAASTPPPPPPPGSTARPCPPSGPDASPPSP